MENNEIKERFRHPRDRGTVSSEEWRRIRKDRGIIDRKKGPDVFKEYYEALMWDIQRSWIKEKEEKKD